MRLEMAWGPMLRRAGPPRGLKNLGNTCYLNSVLQCLAHTPPFAQFCLTSQHSSLCKAVFANRDKECGFCILERQIVRLHTSQTNGMIPAVDSPSKVLKCLSVFAEHFKWGRQEDAHEFLRYVIDTCHTVSAKLAKARSTGVTHNGLVEKSGPVGMVIRDIFGGALLSQVKCMSCKGESNKTDEIMDLSLDLCQNDSLKDALARFFKPEVLDGSNKYSCERCKKLSVARKQMFVSRAPNVLVIQLKRFEGLLGSKINRHIEFEEDLLLSSYMFDGTKDSHSDYSLFSSIVHSGYSAESGHYYAYIKDASGSWYRCNDTQISRSSSQEVLSEKVYILFYMLKNPNHPTKPNKITKNGYTNGAAPPMRPSHSNGTEISKAPVIKQNGVFSTAKANGAIAPNPSVKQIGTVKFEIKRLISNSNGASKTEVRNNGTAVKKNSLNKVSLSPSNSGSSGGSKSVNKGKALISNGSSNKNGCVLKEISPNNVKRELDRPVNRDTGEGQSSSTNVNVLKEFHQSNGSRGPDHPLSQETGGVQSRISVTEKKPCSSSNAIGAVSYPEESENLLKRESSSHETPQDSRMLRSYEQLQKLKELLVREASSELRSCNWVDDVHNYMRDRKRLCVRQSVSKSLGSALLREQLINDSKKIFQSQIPNSLKGKLHQRILSYYKDTSLPDS